MNKMILANLVHRPVRSLISVIAIAVEVTLILLMVGLATGLLGDYRQRQEGIGGDVVVRPPASSALMGLSSASMPIGVGNVLTGLPHVKVASPVIAQTNPGTVEVIFGIDLNTFDQLGRPFRFIEGGPYQGPNDVIVDEFFAKSKNAKVGQTIDVMNNPFRICGIVEQGRGARKFLQIGKMQELVGAEKKASVFFVKLDDPRNAEAVKAAILSQPGMKTYSIYTMSEYLSMFTVANLPGLPAFISVVIGVAVVIGFIVIFQAMYTAVMERTREIGILKSLGASRMYIVQIILRETVLLAVCGIIVGIAISYGAREAIIAAKPTLRVIVPTGWLGWAALIAITGAILGALYPAAKAARKDPIDALAYE